MNNKIKDFLPNTNRQEEIIITIAYGLICDGLIFSGKFCKYNKKGLKSRGNLFIF